MARENVIDVVLVSLLLTLEHIQSFFFFFSVHFDLVNVY